MLAKPINELNETELLEWVSTRRERRKMRLKKVSKRNTVASLATAWRVEKEVLEKLAAQVIGSKEGKE